MSNPIDAVKARLDEGRLWQKGDVGEYDALDQPVCLMGACHFVSHDILRVFHVAASLAAVIAEQYPERTEHQDDIGVVAPFNDHEDTTWPDVELVLDKASVLWDEQNS